MGVLCFVGGIPFLFMLMVYALRSTFLYFITFTGSRIRWFLCAVLVVCSLLCIFNTLFLL